ncbi:MAG: peptide chain release factor-like protein [Sandaracinus sp.]
MSGRGAREIFADEGGGHRWQRVPPNDKRGRVQTSTVTVVVLPEPTEVEVVIDPRDLEWSTCRASGDGGQHLQKTESAVQLRHRPSGLAVRCESERSQHQNRATALAVLRARLHARAQEAARAVRDAARRAQAGSGERGDKRRTIRVQADQVVDHVTGRRWTYRDYRRGDWA